MEQIQSFIQSPLGQGVLSVLWALVILLIGYIIARIIASIARGILNRISLDNRLAEQLSDPDEPREVKVEDTTGRVVFWIVMIFVIVAALDALNLDAISGPLGLFLDELMTTWLPAILRALILLLIAWAIAAVVRLLVRKIGKMFKVDEQLTKHTALQEGEQVSIIEPLATAAYWFIFLLFIPAILQALNVTALAVPLTAAVNDIFGYLPNILSAAIIAVIGWFLAKIIRNVVTNLLRAIGTDRLGERLGIPGERSLSDILGTILFVVILILVIIQALDQLNIAAISDPLNNVLMMILEAIPAILGAIVILVVAYFVGKIISGLVESLLSTVGFDSVPERLGLSWSATRSPSSWIAWLVWILIMIFAVTSAVELLGSDFLVEAMNTFITLLWNVFLAAVMFAFGLYFANLAYRIILETGTDNALFMARMAKALIIIFAGAIALGQIGIAREIINLAFGISLGAIGLAFALAFGLGIGLSKRDIPGREVEKLIDDWRSPPAGSAESESSDVV